ncbi:MAG TPA: hypothetical protein VGJ71_01800 [Candidatus Limnocylindrales bacterium]|jgi:hypothetical protein
MEVDLPNGGRLIVAFANSEIRKSEGAVAIAATIVSATGGESELEVAIVHEAAAHGLAAHPSRGRHPTTILIRPAPDPAAEPSSPDGAR